MAENNIDSLPRKVLVLNVWLTQGLLAVLSFIAGLFVFDHFSSFIQLWQFSWKNLVLYGITFSFVIILFNVLFSKIVPEEWFDDGGINEKLFGQSTVGEILLLSLVIAICEETFFRGMLQSQFGLIVASIIFACIHFRYLKNFFLFSFILGVSIMFGVLFELTGSLTINVFTHFVIDSVLGLVLLYDNKKRNRIDE